MIALSFIADWRSSSGLVTFPAWHDLSAGVTAKGPNPVLPVDQKQCVEPVAL